MTAKVLIFDDDPDILELCSIILRDKGYETVGVTDCRDPIRRIEEIKPDVILMDNRIPDTGGIEATQLIKKTETTSRIPVIFFSAGEDVEWLAEQAKADYFLCKPFGLGELENIVAMAAGILPNENISKTTPEN